MGRWKDGEMGRWGDGEMGRWGDRLLHKWIDLKFIAFLLLMRYIQFYYPTPYSLKPRTKVPHPIKNHYSYYRVILPVPCSQIRCSLP
ncbi:MAG: hypothetical protein F6J90_01985 [Moorea sp. SIOASIH]|uniref:hypothetical protein n=1 Tax=Moorena sp. SIOASIH TaxID=2607817 RepID=UPI0013B9976F|nr:hypothetical protein [Moorena sp. SIOASIH]NEO35139.1 hypothetical protein [Moorena sp. SIOASIH]